MTFFPLNFILREMSFAHVIHLRSKQITNGRTAMWTAENIETMEWRWQVLMVLVLIDKIKLCIKPSGHSLGESLTAQKLNINKFCLFSQCPKLMRTTMLREIRFYKGFISLGAPQSPLLATSLNYGH